MAEIAFFIFALAFFLYVIWTITTDHRDNQLWQHTMAESYNAFRQRMAERSSKHKTPDQ